MEFRTLEDIMAAHAILQLGSAFAFKIQQQQQEEEVYSNQEEVLDLSCSSRASSPASSISDCSEDSCNSLEMSLTVPRGQKLKSCDDCGKVFASSSNLARHRQIHANKGRSCG